MKTNLFLKDFQDLIDKRNKLEQLLIEHIRKRNLKPGLEEFLLFSQNHIIIHYLKLLVEPLLDKDPRK